MGESLFSNPAEVRMKILESFGVALIFGAIMLIDYPKLKATAKKKKYMVIYGVIIAVGILVGTLRLFDAFPDYGKSIVAQFQQMTGIK